ncbi:ABC transporter ATP-binding protein [Gulosibacter sediminis]|uniref:ABC transporter ATP-binding protein n=1 Tax=Gulosibacter sediminis TaxID=1729695 RepID=UPI0024AA01DE|nr:ABC transporter ATP-binding protein [Gulosibacter sediminis]
MSNSRSPFARGTDSSAPRATLRQLWPYLFADKRMLALIIIISLVGAVFSLTQPVLMGLLIQQVEQGAMQWWIAWLLVAVVILAALLSGMQHFLLQRTGETIVLNARRNLIRKILRLPISEFDARRTGDLVSRVGSDTTLLRAVLTQGLIEAIGGVLTFAGAIVAMLILDWVLFLITFACVAISAVVVVALGGRVMRASAAAQAKVGELSSSTERAISAMRTLRAANATEREERKVIEDAEGAYRRGLDIAAISAVMVPVSFLALQLSLVLVLGVGGARVAAGSLTVASLISFIMFLFLMIAPLTQFFGAISAVASALGALGRIEEIVNLPDEEANDRTSGAAVALRGPANVDAEPSAPAIEFANVSFRYPERVVRAAQARADASARFDGFVTARGRAAQKDADKLLMIDESTQVESPLVLDEVSFTVPRGHKVALVGPSGAGKSTSLALIERFYDPISGVISLGGVDLRAIERPQLRDQLGYVQQNSPTLAGTIRDNLLLGNPGASDDECVAVLRQVNLGGVVDRSPAGLDAQVGESGVRLSGGEQQRLAIARTLLSAPPVLLLDESTSALDGENEALMRGALDTVSEGRSMLMIAHRLSTVVDADEILVLDGGRIIGRGTHEQLLETTPLYRRLAEYQLLA